MTKKRKQSSEIPVHKFSDDESDMGDFIVPDDDYEPNYSYNNHPLKKILSLNNNIEYNTQ